MSNDRLADLIQAFQGCYGDLVKFLTGKLGCSALAQDVTHDVYVRMAGAELSADLRSPRAFLFTVASNLAVNVRRRESLRQELIATDQVVAEIPSARPSADRVIGAKEDLALVVHALNDLPPNCRKAVLLNRVKGLTHAEIAKRLGVSERMVGKYIARGVDHCHKVLARQ